MWLTYATKKSSTMSYNPSVTKVICEELRSHLSCKEWTRVLLAEQFPLQMSPVTQLWVH